MNSAPQASLANSSPQALPVNPEGIPDALKEFNHWIVWRAVPKQDGNGFDKVPHNAKDGSKASSTDSRTWSTFLEALEAYKSSPDRWDGIGFVLSSGDPFVLIDFDDCRNPDTGEVKEDVLTFIGRFKSSYVEVSPSGRGVHLVTCGKLRNGAKKGAYEMYGQERFMTMTGEVVDA